MNSYNTNISIPRTIPCAKKIIEAARALGLSTLKNYSLQEGFRYWFSIPLPEHDHH